MSTTTFIEATSADPFVRDLHRKAVRLLNDPSLDRQRREFHMRRLQSILIEHQQKQAEKAERKLAKNASREMVSRENRNLGVADPSQVVARRKEIAMKEIAAKAEQATAEPVAQLLAAPTMVVDEEGANDSQTPVRGRTVLTLKRA